MEGGFGMLACCGVSVVATQPTWGGGRDSFDQLVHDPLHLWYAARRARESAREAHPRVAVFLVPLTDL